MTPIINDMDPPPNTNYGCCSGTYQRTNYNTWLAGNSAGITRRLWSYLDCESAACGDGNSNSYNVNWPNWEVDGTPTANRAMEWLTFYHQQTGELYFGTTICWNVYCPGDTWTNVKYGGVWGDGTLVYPGRAASNTVYPENVGTTYAIWLPSLRLKLIRDGYQDFEYLNVLTNLGHGTYVQTQITSWITNSTTFNNNGTALQTARTNLGNALHQLTYPPVLLPPPSLNGTLQ
jgi:hypothetical protein